MSALLAAGAALAASLITGILTWLAGRSQLKQQSLDQQKARIEQLRRDTYARCGEHLMAYLAQLNNWTVLGWNAGEEDLRDVRRGATELRREGLSCTAAVSLVGPLAMVERFQDAHNRLLSVERKLVRALTIPRPTDEPSDLKFGYLDTYGTDRALEAFFGEARATLGFSEIDEPAP
ncbi:hypothetical protein [Streptomyces xanthophaeus]|uniref:Uncharacterized protein n=1 Tax=Streptomyces xanthophaeus TaxID=67385 RepID=A0A919LFC3_9ACTN|nr:hypothetical protein [Streptomyces xanthophaeus]GHI88761.1 hypothetical protein Sxan_61250 [Streptomyces xanthophaeus]